MSYFFSKKLEIHGLKFTLSDVTSFPPDNLSGPRKKIFSPVQRTNKKVLAKLITKIESIRLLCLFKRYKSSVISSYIYAYILPTYISPTAKYGNDEHDKLHRTNQLWRTVENTTRCQSDPIEHVINLSKRHLQKRYFNF